MEDQGTYDLGSGFSYSFFVAGPDEIQAGVILFHVGDGAIASCWFDLSEVRAISGPYGKCTFWALHSLDPLHLEPSIQTYQKDGRTKQYHGHIRAGRWKHA